jgi:hypothetical protein
MNENENYSDSGEPARERQARNFDAYLLEKISGLQGMMVVLTLAGLVVLGAGLWWVTRHAGQSVDERLAGSNRRLVDLEVERGGWMQRFAEQGQRLISLSNALGLKAEATASNVQFFTSDQAANFQKLSNGHATSLSSNMAAHQSFLDRLVRQEELATNWNAWTQRVDSAMRTAEAAHRALDELQKRFSALEAEVKVLRRTPVGSNEPLPTKPPANAPP